MKKNKQNAVNKESKKIAQKQTKKIIANELKTAIAKFTHTSKKAEKVIDKAVAQLVKKLAKDLKVAEQSKVEEVIETPIVITETNEVAENLPSLAKNKKTAKVS